MQAIDTGICLHHGLRPTSDWEGAQVLMWVISVQWKEPVLMPLSSLFVCSAAREKTSGAGVWWQQEQLHINCPMASELSSETEFFSLLSHQWGLSGPHHSTKTQREDHIRPTVDHGPGARVFVELLHYSCCSARCLDSTAIGRLMGFRWEINGASFLQKCISVRITTLWGIITLTQSIWRKICQQFFGIKHVDFWFYIIYAFLKVVIIQISQDYLFLWNFPLWRISTFWGFVLNWNENKFQNLKVVCETQFPFSGQLKFQARTCIIAPLQGIPLGKNVSEWIQWCKRTVFRICPSLQGGGGATENFPK